MKRETDYTHPEPPNDIPASNGLMNQATTKLFSLPWPRKPLGGKKGPKGKPGPRTTRSGVHKLSKIPKHSSWY